VPSQVNPPVVAARRHGLERAAADVDRALRSALTAGGDEEVVDRDGAAGLIDGADRGAEEADDESAVLTGNRVSAAAGRGDSARAAHVQNARAIECDDAGERRGHAAAADRQRAAEARGVAD